MKNVSSRMKTASKSGGKHLVVHALLMATLPLWEQLYDRAEFYPIGVGILLLGLCCVFRFMRRPFVSLPRTDGMFVLCLLYVVGRSVCQGDTALGTWFLFLYAGMVYVTARLADRKGRKALLYGLWAGGILQGILVWLQYAGVCASSHRWFECTGSFLNPAPLGGWLAISMAVALHMLTYRRTSLSWKLTGWATVLLMGSALVVADSRSAFLSFGIMAMMLVMEKARIRCGWRWTVIVGATLIAVLPLYLYRRSSADARVFIWKVCTEMVKDAPLFGHGTEGVKRNYMHYQAEYLAEEGTAYERVQATDNILAFNEGLRTACEYGLVGLCLTALLLTMAWRESTPGNPFRHLFVGMLVFSCFSYPLSVFSLLTLSFLIMGCLPAKLFKRMDVRKRMAIGLLAIPMLLGAGYVVFGNRATHALDYFYWDEKSEAEWRRYYPLLHNECEPVSRYAHSLVLNGEYASAIEPLEQLIKFSPTVEIYCDLGYCYQSVGKVTDAESCYRYASALAPGRIIPHYRLFCLYRLQKDWKRMCEEGEYILTMDVKIENEKVKRIREEVRMMLLK